MTHSQPDNQSGGPQQGHPQAPQPGGSSFFSWLRSLGVQRGTDRWGGGVCSGLAARVGWDPIIIRILWFVAALFAGLGIALYGIAWLLLPDERDGQILAESALQGRVRAPFVISIIMTVLGLTSSTLLPPHFFGASLLIIIVILAVIASWGHGYNTKYPANPDGQAPSPAYQHRTDYFEATQFPANPMAAGAAADGQTGRQGAETTGTPQSQAAGSAQQAPNRGTASFGGPAWNANQQTWQNGQPTADWNGAPYQPHYERYQQRLDRKYQKYQQKFAWNYGPANQAPTGNQTYLTRKAPGPALTGILAGLYFLSAAAAVAAVALFPPLSGWIVFAAWSLAWALILGLVMIILGIAGRRPGKVAPLIVFTFIFAILSSSMAQADIVRTGVPFSGEQSFFSSVTYTAHDMKQLRDGINFVGASVTIDLTNWSDQSGHATGQTSSCPNGPVRLNAVMSSVNLLLPAGCDWTGSDLTTVMSQGPRSSGSDTTSSPDNRLDLSGNLVMSRITIDN